jgi:hypothetical protein
MDDVDEIDDSHPESADAFAAYIAEGGIEDQDRAPVYCPGKFFTYHKNIFVSQNKKRIFSGSRWTL